MRTSSLPPATAPSAIRTTSVTRRSPPLPSVLAYPGRRRKAAARMATLMASQGFSAPQIAAQLGHADGGVLAMRAYIHAEMPDVGFIDAALS